MCQGFGRQVLGLLPASHLACVSHSPARPSSVLERGKERERGEREGSKGRKGGGGERERQEREERRLGGKRKEGERN